MGISELVRWLVGLATASARPGGAAGSVLAAAKAAVRSFAAHTGVPVVLVTAIAVCIGVRIVKRSARFVTEVAVVAGALLVAWHLGWISW